VLWIGVLLLVCLLLYGKSCGVEIKPITMALLKVSIPILTIISLIMVYEAKTTLEACDDEEDQFASALLSDNEDVLSAKSVTMFDAKILESILTINRECFPSDWQYEDSREYYKGMLSNTTNINIILTVNKKYVGYLLAIPHKQAFKELRNDDEQMEEDIKSFYIETAAILAEFRGRNGLDLMLKKLVPINV